MFKWRTMTTVVMAASVMAACQRQSEPSAENIYERSGGQLARQTVVPSTQSLADRIILDGLYEVDAANIALARAQRPETAAFARLMIDNFSTRTANLTVDLKNLKVQTRLPETLDQDRRSRLARLSAADKANFDALYLVEERKAHQDALAPIGGYADFGDEPVLRARAAEAKTTIQHQIDRLNRIGAPKLNPEGN
jgi:putative membrane protein